MSKNKDIETLHKINGEPYRVCRAKMKANNWDLRGALGSNIFDTVQISLEAFCEAFRSLGDALRKTWESIDWEGIRKAALDLKRMQDERLIQCTAEHCTEEGCEHCAGYEPVGGWITLADEKDGTQ